MVLSRSWLGRLNRAENITLQCRPCAFYLQEVFATEIPDTRAQNKIPSKTECTLATCASVIHFSPSHQASSPVTRHMFQADSGFTVMFPPSLSLSLMFEPAALHTGADGDAVM